MNSKNSPWTTDSIPIVKRRPIIADDANGPCICAKHGRQECISKGEDNYTSYSTESDSDTGVSCSSQEQCLCAKQGEHDCIVRRRDGSSISSIEKSPHKSQPPKSTEKSSISVIFTDWVPGNSSGSENESNNSQISSQSPEKEDQLSHIFPNPGGHDSYMPRIGGQRPRYFQLHRGHRPGLGLSVNESIGLTKRKKRKNPVNLLENPSLLAKRLKVSPDKPASQIIHELDPDLQYIFDEVKVEDGKAPPTFSCSIKFPAAAMDGAVFIGEGRSKKLAKNDAATKILLSLGVEIPTSNVETEGDSQSSENRPSSIQNNVSPSSTNFTPTPRISYGYGQEMDFTSDELYEGNFSTSASSTPSESPTVLSQPMISEVFLRRLRNIPNFEENILLALNTVSRDVEYQVMSEEGPPHDKKFVVKLNCSGHEFIGEGGSKKKAKANSAKQALLTLLGADCYNCLVRSAPSQPHPMPLSEAFNMDNVIRGSNKKKSKSKRKSLDGGMMEVEDADPEEDNHEYDMNFSDYVCNLVKEKFDELISADSNYSVFKVRAGAVMSRRSPIIYNSEVIALATGTKCIEGDFMSQDGLAINDCHAEVLVTRCVRDYLYSQIDILENSKSEEELNECILERVTAPEPGDARKYRLKPDIKFHLYISTSPCGDARIFSPKGLEVEDSSDILTDINIEDTHPNKLNRGVLRSKIEAGEGTIPSANLYSGPQTWDSIVSGNALYTMSCSDKVCRWNVLGLQGALLYNLLGNIHYSSITLGSLHHPIHFKRAVYGRIEALDSRLPVPFSVMKPKLTMVSHEEKRRVKKSPNHAVSWAKGWSTPEVLAASKGRCEPGGVASRLTKRLAFQRFLSLYKNDSGRRDNFADLTYNEAKNLAKDYQKAKEEFINFFKESKLGPWIGKPLEQDLFKIK